MSMKNDKKIKIINRGFIAVTAIILLAMAGFIFSLTTFNAVIIYADSIDKKEQRVQKNLNKIACQETISLIKTKDYYVKGNIVLEEFDCSQEI